MLDVKAASSSVHGTRKLIGISMKSNLREVEIFPCICRRALKHTQGYICTHEKKKRKGIYL
jgi:hypothetical protein